MLINLTFIRYDASNKTSDNCKKNQLNWIFHIYDRLGVPVYLLLIVMSPADKDLPSLTVAGKKLLLPNSLKLFDSINIVNNDW